MLISWLIASGQVQGGARQTCRNTWESTVSFLHRGLGGQTISLAEGLDQSRNGRDAREKKPHKELWGSGQNLTRTEAFSSQQLS